MDSSISLHWIDYLILAVYLAALIGIGVYHARKPKDLKEFFLAGKSMRWIPIGLSLMAALNSGIDYVAQPAGMIKFGAVGFLVNLSWFLLYPYVFFITLPMFRRLNGYSAYGYLENRFGPVVRALAAAIFLLWRMGWMGTALYVPCLAIAVASGHIDYVTHMVIVLGAIVTFYTMMGGIRAVIWTDVAQFFIMFGGLFVTFAVVLWNIDGGLGAIFSNIMAVGSLKYAAPPGMEHAGALAHLKEYFFIPLPVIGLIITCMVGRLTIYTSDQVMIQRFQTSKTIRDARQGFIITAIGDAVWVFALGGLGVALYTYFGANGWPPLAIREHPDQLFPYFMGKVFPVGLTGLVIAAILAASLSSIDSAVSSMTTVAMADFYNRLYLKRTVEGMDDLSAQEQRRQLLVSRVLTVCIGIMGIIIACNVHRLGTIVEIANKLVNGFTGPILGIFLLGMFSLRANERGVFIGGILGSVASLYAIFWSSPDLLQQSLPFLLGIFPKAVSQPGGAALSFIWPSTVGFVTTAAFGYLASLFSPRITPSAREWNWYAITRRELVE